MTLPLTYSRVTSHPSVIDIYRRRLLAEGVVSEAELAGWQVYVITCC